MHKLAALALALSSCATGPSSSGRPDGPDLPAQTDAAADAQFEDAAPPAQDTATQADAAQKDAHAQTDAPAQSDAPAQADAGSPAPGSLGGFCRTSGLLCDTGLGCALWIWTCVSPCGALGGWCCDDDPTPYCTDGISRCSPYSHICVDCGLINDDCCIVDGDRVCEGGNACIWCTYCTPPKYHCINS